MKHPLAIFFAPLVVAYALSHSVQAASMESKIVSGFECKTVLKAVGDPNIQISVKHIYEPAKDNPKNLLNFGSRVEFKLDREQPSRISEIFPKDGLQYERFTSSVVPFQANDGKWLSQIDYSMPDSDIKFLINIDSNDHFVDGFLIIGKGTELDLTTSTPQGKFFADNQLIDPKTRLALTWSRWMKTLKRLRRKN